MTSTSIQCSFGNKKGACTEIIVRKNGHTYLDFSNETKHRIIVVHVLLQHH